VSPYVIRRDKNNFNLDCYIMTKNKQLYQLDKIPDEIDMLLAAYLSLIKTCEQQKDTPHSPLTSWPRQRIRDKNKRNS
jgi:hypothetical protein